MRPIRLHLDACVGIAPAHDLPRLLQAALVHMPRSAPTDLRAVVLAEQAEDSFFMDMAQDEIRLPGQLWRIVGWDPDGGVKIRHMPDHRDLWILAGRRAISAEGLEVCALFRDAPLESGQPMRELIRSIVESNGLAALCGTSGRSTLRADSIRSLLMEFPPDRLVVVDSALRYRGRPTPRYLSLARKTGHLQLAGSDPLPLPGEEETVGTYHATFHIPAPEDPARLVLPLRQALAGGQLDIRLEGRRRNAWDVIRQQRRLARQPAAP